MTVMDPRGDREPRTSGVRAKRCFHLFHNGRGFSASLKRVIPLYTYVSTKALGQIDDGGCVSIFDTLGNATIVERLSSSSSMNPYIGIVDIRRTRGGTIPTVALL